MANVLNDILSIDTSISKENKFLFAITEKQQVKNKTEWQKEIVL